MAGPKTKPSMRSVRDFLKTIDDLQLRQDCAVVAALMRRATGQRARIWGENIVGFGHYEYEQADGQPASWFITGFSPRKRDLAIYIMTDFSRYSTLMKRLGRFRTGKSCLYVNRLSDIDIATLAELIQLSVRDVERKYG